MLFHQFLDFKSINNDFSAVLDAFQATLLKLDLCETSCKLFRAIKYQASTTIHADKVSIVSHSKKAVLSIEQPIKHFVLRNTALEFEFP